MAGKMFSAALLACLVPLTLCSQSYAAFRRTHRRSQSSGQDDVHTEVRKKIFEHRQAEVVAHNALNRSWRMAVNRFSDYTGEELDRLLGYKRVGGRPGSTSFASIRGSALMQMSADELDIENLAKEVDWRHNLKSSTWVRNQGHCGSCWAVAAVGAMEMMAERQLGTATKLSHQQLVECVPNPKHCGGTGGCKGATSELAFDYVQKNGIASLKEYKRSSPEYMDGFCDSSAPTALKLSRFVRLPENQVKYLYHAIATKGPTVVSVAGKSWFHYGSGVFDGCDKNAIVSHAVLAVGYGHESSSNKDYWLVRNSWGKHWGEHGHIRVQRHMDDSAWSGIDNDPKKGVYCDDAPAEVPVSGMCGITSDSAYPVIDTTAEDEDAIQTAPQQAPRKRLMRDGNPKTETPTLKLASSVGSLSEIKSQRRLMRDRKQMPEYRKLLSGTNYPSQHKLHKKNVHRAHRVK